MYMKNCASCNNKIKNSYTLCYECNNKKDDNSVSLSSCETIYKKENIPKCVKACLWHNYFGDSRIGKCQCCMREPITMSNFHSGHIQSERHGGKTALDNLKPICVSCNLSMGTENMDSFIKRYNLHYGLDKNNI